MSAIRDRVRAMSQAAVRSEVVELDGIRFLARGLMTGDALRVHDAQKLGGSERSLPLTIALGAFDPDAPDTPIWNPNDAEHVAEIKALPLHVTKALSEAVNRVSDVKPNAEGNAQSTAGTSSLSSLPAPLADAPSQS